MYGKVDDAPKRPKYDKDAREDRIKPIEEERDDVTRILQFKQRRLLQEEAAKHYQTCEQLMEEEWSGASPTPPSGGSPPLSGAPPSPVQNSSPRRNSPSFSPSNWLSQFRTHLFK